MESKASRSTTPSQNGSSVAILRSVGVETKLILPPMVKLNIKPELLTGLIELDTRLKLCGYGSCHPRCNKPQCKVHLNLINLVLYFKKEASPYDLEKEFKSLCLLSGDEDCKSLAEEMGLNEEQVKSLRDNTSDEERLIIEEYKLTIIKAFQNHLEQDRKLQPASDQIIEDEAELTEMWFENERYVFTTGTVLFFMVLGNFIGTVQLLSEIPKIPFAALYGVSSLLCAAECFLHYVMMVPAFEKVFKTAARAKKRTLLDIYQEQIQAVEKINQQLSGNPAATSSISTSDFGIYRKLVLFFNKYISDMNDKSINVGILKTGLSWGLGVVNFGMTISGTYFWANQLLTLASTALGGVTLIGTPLGWVFTVALILFSIHNNYTLRSTNVSVVLNPDIPRSKILNKYLDRFRKSKDKKDCDLNYVHSQKIKDEKTLVEVKGSNVQQHESKLEYTTPRPQSPPLVKEVERALGLTVIKLNL